MTHWFKPCKLFMNRTNYLDIYSDSVCYLAYIKCCNAYTIQYYTQIIELNTTDKLCYLGNQTIIYYK